LLRQIRWMSKLAHRCLNLLLECRNKNCLRLLKSKHSCLAQVLGGDLLRSIMSKDTGTSLWWQDYRFWSYSEGLKWSYFLLCFSSRHSCKMSNCMCKCTQIQFCKLMSIHHHCGCFYRHTISPLEHPVLQAKQVFSRGSL